MNESVTADQNTWSYMSGLVESITQRLMDLETANITGFEDWIEPVLKALENIADESQEVR